MAKLSLEKLVIKNNKFFVLLIILSIVLLLFYMNTSTGIFYSELENEPVTIYYSQSESIQPYPITNVEIFVNNLVVGGSNDFSVYFDGISTEVEFWESISDDVQAYNYTLEEEYQNTNIPDYLIESNFIHYGYVPVWSQIWYAQTSYSVNCTSTLTHTSYGKWEGKYYFNSGMTSTTIDGQTYLIASVNKMTFYFQHSDNYEITISGNARTETFNNHVWTIVELEPGDTFHIIVTEKGTKVSQSIGEFSIIFTGSLILYTSGVIIYKLYHWKTKPQKEIKKRSKKRKR